jgi:hypothetical protein
MNFKPSFGLRMAMTVTAMACCLAPLPVLAQSTELATRTGNEFGVSASNYKYAEPGHMSIKATKIGFDYTGTYAIGSQGSNRSDGWFLRGNLRYATGKGDYSSGPTGSMNNRPDWYYEVKGLIGKDFFFDAYTLSPYAGLGYRYLFSDLRGVSSTGANGYRRESTYYTLPIGVTQKMNLADNKQLHTTLEYSYLISGQQDVKLSEAVSTNQDVSLRQRSGYGLSLGTMVRFDTWSVGPSLTLWRVKESDRGGGYVEPRNNTYEFGVKAAYHF